MSNEIIDICDENNNIIGTAQRKQAHKDGLWHRTAHVWIYNSQGEILLQLRAKNKDFFPNMWDIAVAGHITSNEKAEDAALREIHEEIGLKIQREDLEFIDIRKKQYQYGNITENVFHYIYFLRYDDALENMKFHDGEVQDTRFISLEIIETELENHSDMYVPRYWKDIIHIIKARI